MSGWRHYLFYFFTSITIFYHTKLFQRFPRPHGLLCFRSRSFYSPAHRLFFPLLSLSRFPSLSSFQFGFRESFRPPFVQRKLYSFLFIIFIFIIIVRIIVIKEHDRRRVRAQILVFVPLPLPPHSPPLRRRPRHERFPRERRIRRHQRLSLVLSRDSYIRWTAKENLRRRRWEQPRRHRARVEIFRKKKKKLFFFFFFFHHRRLYRRRLSSHQHISIVVTQHICEQ